MRMETIQTTHRMIKQLLLYVVVAFLLIAGFDLVESLSSIDETGEEEDVTVGFTNSSELSCNTVRANVGWSIKKRDKHDKGGSKGQVDVIDGQRIACDGFVTKWNFYPEDKSSFRAIIFRGTDVETIWQIVGMNDIPKEEVFPDKVNLYTVPREAVIHVRANDVIGIAWTKPGPMITWCSKSSSFGACIYRRNSHRFRLDDFTASDLTVGQRVTTDPKNKLREWSISAEVSYNESVHPVQETTQNWRDGDEYNQHVGTTAFGNVGASNISSPSAKHATSSGVNGYATEATTHTSTSSTDVNTGGNGYATEATKYTSTSSTDVNTGVNGYATEATQYTSMSSTDVNTGVNGYATEATTYTSTSSTDVNTGGISYLSTLTSAAMDDDKLPKATTGLPITEHEADLFFNESFDAALNKVEAFEPDKNTSYDKQIDELEVLGEEVLADINEAINKLNINQTNDDRQSEEKQLANIIERAADIIEQVAQHLPGKGEVYLETVGIAAFAKDISNVDRPLTLSVYKVNGSNDQSCQGQGSKCDGRSSSPSVTMSPSALNKFPPGRKLIAITYMNNNHDGVENRTESVDIKSQTEQSTNPTTALASGIINIRLTVNGFTSYVEMDIDLPIQKPLDTLLSVPKNEETVCAYWNNENQIFTTGGCYKTKESDNVVSSHLVPSKGVKSFAILLQINAESISVENQQVLGMLTKICSSASLLALAATILVLLAFESLRKSDRNIIHMNLAMSLFSAQLLFLVTVDKTENEIMCNIIAMLLHYLFLSVFGWMLVEGVNLYYKIIKVYGAEKNRLSLYVGIGWGMPAPIVIISAGVRFHSYSAIDSCWLNTANGLIWAFAGPVIFVLIVNTAVLCGIGRILYRSTANSLNDKNMKGVRTSLRGALILTPLLGTPWILGLFATGDANVLFQYLFVIINSIQGVLIFGIYCLFNKEVRSVVRKSFQRRHLTIVVPLDHLQNDKSVITVTEQIADIQLHNPPMTNQISALLKVPDMEDERTRRRKETLAFYHQLIDDLDGAQ